VTGAVNRADGTRWLPDGPRRPARLAHSVRRVRRAALRRCASTRTICAQPDHASAVTQLHKVSDGLCAASPGGGAARGEPGRSHERQGPGVAANWRAASRDPRQRSRTAGAGTPESPSRGRRPKRRPL